MKYKIIFTTGYDDDLESISKELKCDVLISPLFDLLVQRKSKYR